MCNATGTKTSRGTGHNAGELTDPRQTHQAARHILRHKYQVKPETWLRMPEPRKQGGSLAVLCKKSETRTSTQAHKHAQHTSTRRQREGRHARTKQGNRGLDFTKPAHSESILAVPKRTFQTGAERISPPWTAKLQQNGEGLSP